MLSFNSFFKSVNDAKFGPSEVTFLRLMPSTEDSVKKRILRSQVVLKSFKFIVFKRSKCLQLWVRKQLRCLWKINNATGNLSNFSS